MKNYWYKLTTRERLLAGLTAGVTILYFVYLIVYAPLLRSEKLRLAEKQTKTETLIWMRHTLDEYKTNKLRQKIGTSQMLALLSKQIQASAFKTFPYQLQQTNAQDIQLRFEQVPYNLFVAWLAALDEHYLVEIKHLNIQRTNTTGIIKSEVTLTTV